MHRRLQHYHSRCYCNAQSISKFRLFNHQIFTFFWAIRNPKDEREVLIHLTEKGDTLKIEASNITRCIVDTLGMDADAVADIKASVDKIRDRIHRAHRPDIWWSYKDNRVLHNMKLQGGYLLEFIQGINPRKPGVVLQVAFCWRL